MGEELILSSRRIQPAKLLAAGYQFRFPDLGQALRHEMARLNAGSDSKPALPVTEIQP
jgi:NAD dependent epimerase/dehydratase family enzyme